MFLKIFNIFILLVNIATPSTANTKTSNETTINALVQEIKQAPNSEKRVKMNQLKLLLKTMNQESRKKVLLNLQKSFAKNNTHTNSASKTKALVPAKEHTHQSKQQIPQHIPQQMGQHMGQQQGGGRR